MPRHLKALGSVALRQEAGQIREQRRLERLLAVHFDDDIELHGRARTPNQRLEPRQAADVAMCSLGAELGQFSLLTRRRRPRA